MYNNNYNTMYGNRQGGGMVYNNQYQAPVMTNALTPEQIKELRRSNHQAAIPQVTQLELTRAICTHRDTTRNQFATVDNQDGTATCTICGEVFKPVEYTKEQVDEIVDEFMNVLQTTKMNYLDMSPSAVSEFFKILPLVKRTPELYKQAMDCFAKYDRGNLFNEQGNNNFFGLFSALTSPNMSYGGPMQNPYGNPYGAGPAPHQYGPMGQGPYDPYNMTPQGGYQPPMPNMQYSNDPNLFYAQPNQQQANMCMNNNQQQPNGQQAQVQPSPAKADVKNVLNS